MQTALSRVYASWSRISRVDSIDAYVRRVIVTTHLNEKRRPWRRERAGLDGIDAAAEDRADPMESDVLWTALRGLAPGQRQVVVLRHYWGLSVDETAAVLGISPGTVKSQTAAALAHLRTALALTSSQGEHR